MTNPQPAASSADVKAIYQLLNTYSFDLEDYFVEEIVAEWLTQYDPVWINHAVTEALYQGRYKLISIDQILRLWHRRGQPIRHFNREFESIILGQTLLMSTGHSDSSQRAVLPFPSQPNVPPHPVPEYDSEVGAEVAIAPPEPLEPEMSAIPPTGLAPDAEPDPDSDPGLDPGSDTGPDEAQSEGTVPPPTDVIQPFVPRREASDLHERLRAVVQAGQPR